MTPPDPIIDALTGYALHIIPEAILGVTACLLFLGGTWKASRSLAGSTALVGLITAGLATYYSLPFIVSARIATIQGAIEILGPLLLGVFLMGLFSRGRPVPLLAAVLGLSLVVLPLWLLKDKLPVTVESRQADIARQANEIREKERAAPRDKTLEADKEKLKEQEAQLRAIKYSSALYYSNLALLIKFIALAAGFILVLLSWDEVPDSQAADYHACLLLIVAGTCLVGAANDLVTLFLSLELVSIPTYILLYLPRYDDASQEAAMKYFLLSIFSSALMLFGFSYLYGITGTTNIPAIVETLSLSKFTSAMQAVPLVALVLVVAGLGFRITAVPFHFYAPDVYQGTSTPGAALLAVLPKIAGFVALFRLLGFVPQELGRSVSDQLPVLLWIMAAVTMSLGNVLALLQDNVKRMLAYSSVAHAGYMLIGLAVADKLLNSTVWVGGIEAVLFYLVAYAAMTIGAFAVLSYLSTPERPVETVDDLAGLGRTRPGVALMMMLFMFSLIGIPLTAGFAGKLFLFVGALSLPNTRALGPGADLPAEQARLFTILALIGVINAAISGYYYLRIVGVMYLRDSLKPIEKPRAWPALISLWLCALLTLAAGIYPTPLVQAAKAAVRGTADGANVAAAGLAPERGAAEGNLPPP